MQTLRTALAAPLLVTLDSAQLEQFWVRTCKPEAGINMADANGVILTAVQALCEGCTSHEQPMPRSRQR